MITVTRTVDIRAPAGRVWALLADIERWPRWFDAPFATHGLALASPGPPGLGCDFILRGRLPYRLFARIVAWEAERALRFDILRSEYPSDRLFFRRASAGFTLEPLAAGGTRVTYRHAVEGKGAPGRLYMSTVFRLFLRTTARRVLAGLRRDAEG